MKDVNQFWRETGSHPDKGGNSLLVGNKDIIKRDILGIDLDKQFKQSIEKITGPLLENETNKTFVIDEVEIEYDHKTMARGNFKEQRQKRLLSQREVQ